MMHQGHPYDPAMQPMQHPPHKVKYAPKNKPLEDKSMQWLKYSLFTYNLLAFLCGCTLLAVGIWMAVDRNFMATITGEALYAVAVYIILAAGAIIFIITFLGWCGAIMENKLILWIFFATLGVIIFILFIGCILAIVFRVQLGEAIQDTMRSTLKEDYGFDLYDRTNRAITDAWDRAQEKLRCCAVDEEGWQLYRETKWFEIYGAKDLSQSQSESETGTEEQKPYVPKSCCVRDRFDQYINEVVCQTWTIGPPAHSEGAINRALYYQGCYNAGVDYLLENSDIIIGLGFTFLLIMIVGMVLSFMLIRKLP